MEYNYHVQLEIANEKDRATFDFTEIEPAIQDTIAEYHKSKTVRHKKVLSYKLSPKILEIGIQSPVMLDTPSKSLAKFTRILITRSPKLAATVANGRVFQSVQTSIPASDLDNISSSETLKKLVDIFCDQPVDAGQQKDDPNILMQRKIKALIFNVESK